MDDGKVTGFDPFPYILYNLVLAILVSLQGPLIVMSQNRQTLKDRAHGGDGLPRQPEERGRHREDARASSARMRAEMAKRLEVLERGTRADRVRAEVAAKTPGGPLG